MSISEKVLLGRKKMGLTQEELASKTNITVRTIQRIEAGETTPRTHTLKTIATALAIPWEELAEVSTHGNVEEIDPAKTDVAPAVQDEREFLQLLCLSCFAYLVVPYIHFLLPMYLAKKRRLHNAVFADFAKKLIRSQIYWVIVLNALLLLIVVYNLVGVAYQNKQATLSYLLPVVVMYVANALLIITKLLRARKLKASLALT